MIRGKPHIVIDDKIPFLEGILEPFARIQYIAGNKITRSHVMNADALLIRTRTKIGPELLSGTSVKFVATATTGHDHIDKDFCLKNGIEWANAPGCNAESVNQYILAALSHLSMLHQFQFRKKTIGIIGVGNVGRKVARSAKLLGMKVLLNDPPRERVEGISKFVSLQQIKEDADIISFHVPLTEDGQYKTKDLFNDEFLNSIQQGTIVLNSSRGEVCNESSLLKGLKTGTILSTALDVWHHEPEINPELLKISDISTPHIAGYSADGKANGTAMSVHALSRHFSLGLDNWYPSEIPLPENKIIRSNFEEDPESQIKSIILSTYPIAVDTNLLKSNPDHFEILRGSYRIRREFKAHIASCSDSQAGKNILGSLGFKLS